MNVPYHFLESTVVVLQGYENLCGPSYSYTAWVRRDNLLGMAGS